MGMEGEFLPRQVQTGHDRPPLLCCADADIVRAWVSWHPSLPCLVLEPLPDATSTAAHGSFLLACRTVRQVGPVPGPTEGIALLWRAGALQRVEVQGAEYRSMTPGDMGLKAEVAGEGCMR